MSSRAERVKTSARSSRPDRSARAAALLRVRGGPSPGHRRTCPCRVRPRLRLYGPPAIAGPDSDRGAQRSGCVRRRWGQAASRPPGPPCRPRLQAPRTVPATARQGSEAARSRSGWTCTRATRPQGGLGPCMPGLRDGRCREPAHTRRDRPPRGHADLRRRLGPGHGDVRADARTLSVAVTIPQPGERLALGGRRPGTM